MKIIPTVKGVREGVDMRTGVWSDSDSLFRAEEEDVAGLLGMVIFGLGFSIFAGNVVDGPGTSGSSLSILMPKEDIVGTGSESESESPSLQIGRWASRTSSSLSFSFCNAAISFCRRDFSSSSWSVSCRAEKNTG